MGHIQPLLLTLFYKLAPQLVKWGMIYAVDPYLYKIEYGTDKYKFLRDDAALAAFIKQNKIKKYKISRFKGIGELSVAECKEICMSDATRTLKQFTLLDAGRAEKAMQLMGKDVDIRKEFLIND